MSEDRGERRGRGAGGIRRAGRLAGFVLVLGLCAPAGAQKPKLETFAVGDGLPSAAIADLARDRDLLDRVGKTAERMMQEHPDAVPELIRRWVGDAESYAQV